MNEEWLASAGRRLDEAVGEFVDTGGSPGAVGIVGDGDATVVVARGVVAPGLAEVQPSAAVRYDIASLTKVLATWPLVGVAVDAGELDLDKPVSAYLGPSSLPGSAITSRQLLSHTSGLRAATRFDQYVGRQEHLADLILGEELDAEPGSRHVYINRGFVLLGLLLEQIFGHGLAAAARDRVWQPWGLRDTQFGPLAAASDVAPTERRLVGARPAWGVVHDENAALLGGVAGHAGVFTTADDLARFCRVAIAAQDADTAFGRYVRESLREHAAGDTVRRGLAWLLAPEHGIVYHHGFTGVSLYLAPDSERFVVFLSNAVFVSRDRERLTRVRSAAYRLIAGDPA